MLISPAYAQAAGGGEGGLAFLIPLVLIFIVFYFLLIRPQQKRMKEHQNMVQALRRGDRVVTGGGLIGTVTKVIDDGEIQVEVAEGVRVRVMRQTIQQVLSKTEPAKKDQDKADNDTKSEGAKSEGAKSEGGGGKGLLGRLRGEDGESSDKEKS